MNLFQVKRSFRFVLVALLACTLASSALGQKGKKKKLPSQKFKGYGLPEAVKTAPENLPRVSPVKSSARGDRQQVADRIDSLIEAKLSEQGLSPNSKADDYTFVRRAYLDIAGTIPSLSQTIAFASDQSQDKHRQLVDRLLGSYGHVSHMYNFWASILRIKDRPQNNILAYPYRDWVKDQIRVNRPYDEWVYEMLTAEGKTWESPAVGYTLRDNSMPLVHVDNTVRVFLGTQIGCAQCHDHPFDRWTQKEFYELAAFSYGTQTRDGKGSDQYKNGNPIERLKKEFKAISGESRLPGSANLLAQANLHSVSFNDKRALKLPHDYQYSDGKPNQKISPKVLWSKIPSSAADKTPREAYAAWLTSADNPLFAKTIANRLWKKVFGVGLIEPIDDIKEGSPCQNEELLAFITDEMVRLDFDQREFLRTLYLTATYGRAASNFDPSESEFYHYPGPRLRRMTAEQVWDSVLTIAIYNPMAVQLPGTEDLASVVDVDLSKVSASELESIKEQFDEQLSPGARNKVINQSVGYRRQALLRASELPSPLPPDHFLRQFGQGDRETIEGDSTAPTVPQILTMFNGPFTHMMLEKGSVIYDNLLRARNPRAALEIMFLSILNRPPTKRDQEVGMREMGRGDAAMGYGNVVWALINTREFLFIQ